MAQTPEHLKTPTAEEAFNPGGLVQRSIRLLKDTFPDLEVGYLLENQIHFIRLNGAISLSCSSSGAVLCKATSLACGTSV